MVIIVIGADIAAVRCHQPSVCLCGRCYLQYTAREGVLYHEESAGVLYEQICFGLQIILSDVCLLPLQPVIHLSAQYCHADV